ncbi:putative tyrosyl-dna phosphodiesterase protein [Botrytis fragariae]|uniref:Putative tyrosyl-dna phosphodiesterase protein n=1 Tax=Botrytis fragariae TaxID=1964551 RepID=A0A8H6EKY7_9HELO|nr:putative tyrosyl-dna phosphodiesterase protein [Botrytis fragariae]KAF5875700.1 putative tyrosyl-dna phosphodiesterase protein [Botrytis fragariae]
MDQHQSQGSDELAQKKRKVDDITNDKDNTNTKTVPRGIHRSISPPPLRRRRIGSPKPVMLEEEESPNRKEVDQKPVELSEQDLMDSKNSVLEHTKRGVVKSPFQLTTIRDLPASSNVDAVSLRDILGDPLISECWEFNYLHNLDFLMEQFDEDVRNLVRVNVIHGFWKREDQSRLNLAEQALKYPNIKLLTAYMPEISMEIPHLPLLGPEKPTPIEPFKIGSGQKFKLDLLNYLRAYDTKRIICKPLVEQLLKYDFSEIKAALIGSVPGKQGIEISPSQTAWGWAGLTNALKSVACYHDAQPEIAIQISSIASLGPTDKWLTHFLKALNTSKFPRKTNPKFRIIFPTADEVRRSINGYASGNAIHTKILTPAQEKQLAYLKPMLCHWAGDGAQHSSPSSSPSNSPSQSSTPSEPKIQEAYRKRAAPHIKTYIRFSSDTSSNSSSQRSIDWVLVTSANLSKQAWGEPLNSAGEVRICSYEIGVLVWPDLWGKKQSGKKVKMVPCFGSDTPFMSSVSSHLEIVDEEKMEIKGEEEIGKRRKDDGRKEEDQEESNTIIVGARMPYDLPLVPYGKDDIPWCASASYSEPDWMGNTWKT